MIDDLAGVAPDAASPGRSAALPWRRLVAVFAAAIIAAEVVLRAASPALPEPVRWANAWQEVKYEAIAARQRSDLVVLGSSIANQAIEPDIIVQETARLSSGFNAALPEASISLMRRWADEVVIPVACPSVVLIGITPRDVNDNALSLQRAVDDYLESPARLELVDSGNITDRLNRSLVQHSALFRRGPAFRRPLDVVRFVADAPPTPWDRPNLAPSGRGTVYDDRTFATNPTRQALLRNDGLYNYGVGGGEMDELRSIIESSRASGALPVIAILPVLDDELVRLLPAAEGDLERAWTAIVDTADEEGVDVIDVRDLVDRSLFADEYHANQQGTVKISTAIGRQLAPILDGIPEPERCENGA